MKILYQGISGSFSEIAAEKLAEQQRLFCYELIPAISSENVCRSLDEGAADYGVVAVRNSSAGIVEETKKALKSRGFLQVSVLPIPIFHYLYKLSDKVTNDNINYVASHEQAINQCRETLKYLIPKAKEIVVEDTALAAKQLRGGFLSSDTAVICSQRAGRLYELCLIREKIQDYENNTTYFALISKIDSSI